MDFLPFPTTCRHSEGVAERLVIRDGKEVVELDVNGRISYMGLHSTTTQGTLMVQICEVPDDLRGEMEARGFLKPR